MSRITLRQSVIPLASAVSGMSMLGVAPVAAAAPTDPAQLAACDFARQYATYDFANYDDYVHRVLDRSTGPFRDQFQGSDPQRRAKVLNSHIRADVQSIECRTDSGDPQHASIVVAVDQTTASDATLGVPRPDHTVLMIGLDNVDGRWLAARVDQPAPQR